MAMFSGDGAGCAARLFKKYGANVAGGLHLKMPDSIGDVKILKKSPAQNRGLIKKADEKIDKAVASIKRGKYTRNGLGFFAHIAGLFGQRLYFGGKTKNYYNKVKADGKKCVGCGICAGVCPMQNIKIEDGKAEFNGKCTMCYRCFSRCPQRAITLLASACTFRTNTKFTGILYDRGQKRSMKRGRYERRIYICGQGTI